MSGSSAREFNYLNRNNIPYGTVGTVTRDTDYMKKDISKIISSNLETKERLDKFESFNNHIESTDNTFSLDNVNSLTSSYIYCMNKLNFTLNCINQYSEEIIAANSYAKVLRPIFEKKYTDNATSTDGYVFIDDIVPKKFKYFFEADSMQDDTTLFTGKYSYLEPLRIIREGKRKKQFDELYAKNPTQKIFYFTDFYNWTDGIKITGLIVIPNILNTNEWVIIGSGFNLTPKIPKYTEISLLPQEYKNYLKKMDDAFQEFCNTTYNPNNGTIYQSGADTDFNILKVVSSKEYPYWNNQLIINSYIRGSNIDMPNVILQINTSLNSNFRGAQEGQIVIIDYVVGDTYYTGIIKFIEVENYGLCYQIIAINKNEIFLPSIKIIGDNQIQGNFNVVNYKGESIINTDNTRKITCFHDKIGINQNPFEVKGLLDIDNLTQQTIFDLFEEFQIPSRNSYDIMRVINGLQNPSINNIPNLFNEGQPLFDYANQCAIISINIKPIIDMSDLSILYNLNFGVLLSDRTFKIIQQRIKELNQMMPDYLNANDPSFVFTFVELFPSLIQSWYFISLRGIIRNGKIILIFTRLTVTNLMVDSSYTKYLLDIADYISRVNRSINFKHLLFKNHAFYNNGVLDVIGYENYIKNNPYFSNNFDLLPESYIFNFNKNNGIYNYIASHLEWTGIDSHICYINSTNAGTVIDIINEQLDTLYSDFTENTVPVVYVLDAKKIITFVNITIINGNKCVIGAGYNIDSLLNQSLLVKGDNKINGNFFINDWNDNVIFKVDNVEKSIINSYKVGIGTDNPQSMLDIRDTTIQDIIDEMNTRSKQYNIMNILTEQLNYASNEDEMRTIMSSIVSTYNNHIGLFKVNTTSLKSEDITVIYHPLYPNWSTYTLGELLDIDLLNNKLINTILLFEQDNYDNEMIFSYMCTNIVMYNPIYGPKNVGRKYFLNNGQLYCYLYHTTLMTNNLNVNVNNKINLLMETRKCFTRMNSDIWRRINNIQNVLNLQEGLNTLNTLMKQTQEIKKNIFKIIFNKTSITTLGSISVSEIDFDTLLESNPSSLDTLSSNKKQKYTNLLASLLLNFTDIKNGYCIHVTYDDNMFDYLAVGFCYNVQGNIITLICVEFCIQDVITPSLNVEGDTKVSGDLLITNKSTGNNFVSIDPIQQFVGINTDERDISYRDTSYTTTSGIYNSKFMVHAQRDAYPVMVSERIQENEADTSDPNNLNLRYFSTNSGFTVKRKSLLYDFNEIKNYSQLLDNTIDKTKDKVTHMRYGSDIAFEVCDKTNRTVELIDIQGTIDSISPEGFLKGGFSVQVNDLTESNNNFDTTKRNLMYVDNSGTLFINKIMLGGKLLEVNSSGQLMWDNKQVNI
jgi:hypothetical protein